MARTQNEHETSGYLRDGDGRLIVVGPDGATIGGAAGLTDTQLRATPVPVSGPATDAQLRATPLPISGSVTVSDGAGPLTVDGTVTANGPITDTQLRASPPPVAATAVTGAVYDTASSGNLTPKRVKVDIAASQSHSAVIAAVAAKKLRVLAAAFVAGGTATTLVFETNTANAAISCIFANGANGGAVLPFNPAGWFETTAGDALNATTGAGSATGILITYVEV